MTKSRAVNAERRKGNNDMRPTVLTFVRHYLPGYKAGGPIRSIANLVEALGDEFDFRIVTSDRDSIDTKPYPGLPAPSTWIPRGKAHVLYLPPSKRDFLSIAQILRTTPHNALYLNSFFDPVFTTLPLLARRLRVAPEKRCILAPRGEFSAGALKLKAKKKAAFMALVRPIGLHNKVVWQASTESERTDILCALKLSEIDVHVAMDIPLTETAPSTKLETRSTGDPIRLCFLSRISPMKNLDFAISVLAQTKCKVIFDIYGSINDNSYWIRCKNLMGNLPNNITCRYKGHDPAP
ncbi:hypothetical protein AB6B38_03225 [Glycocaulis abyssi]|uniref:Glycosyltransferase n=1 Tax=Glycocaulis abyssi TaxID=1433403 RepID=A0ABV9NDN3_9PROT